MKKILFMPFIVFLFLSCSGTAIFYTLENEEKVRDSNNFNSSTPVNHILPFSSGGSDYYITHGKQLWYSLAGSDQNPWQIAPLPSSYSEHVSVPSIAAFGSRLYAVLSDYESDSAVTLGFYTSPDQQMQEVISYHREAGSGDNDFYFYDLALFPVLNGLYISKVKHSWNTQSSSSSSVVGCELYYYGSGDYPDSTLDDAHKVTLTGLSDPFVIKDMVSNGTETYLILNKTGSNVNSYRAGMLFMGVNSNPDSFSEVSMSTNYSYNRIYYSQSTLFISTRSDSRVHPILFKTGAGSWNSINGPDDIQFSSFLDISSIKDHTILVGTRADVISGSQTYYNGDGYYEIDLSDIANPVIRGNTFSSPTNYSSTDLNSATIMDLFLDNKDGRSKIYASTSGTGLWMNKFSSNDNARIWYQE